MVSENLRRDGTLAGNPRKSFSEAVPRRSTAFRPIPAVAAESRQRNGNTTTGEFVRETKTQLKCSGGPMNFANSNAHLGPQPGRNRLMTPLTTPSGPNATSRTSIVSPPLRQTGTRPERACAPPPPVVSRPAQGGFSSPSKPSHQPTPAPGARTASPPAPVKAVQFPPVRCKRLDFQRGAAQEIAAVASTYSYLKIAHKADWVQKANLLASCGSNFIHSKCQCGHILGVIVCSCGLNICSLCLRQKVYRFASQIYEMPLERARHADEMKLRFLEFCLPYSPTVAENISVLGLRSIRGKLQKGIANSWRHYLKLLSVPGRGPGMVLTTNTSTKGHVFARGIFFGREVDESRLNDIFAQSTGARGAAVKSVFPGGVSVSLGATKAMVKFLTLCNLPLQADIMNGEPGEFVDYKLAARIELAFFGHRAVVTFGAFRSLSGGEDKNVWRSALVHCPSCGALNSRTSFVQAPLCQLNRFVTPGWPLAFVHRFKGRIHRPSSMTQAETIGLSDPITIG